MTTEFDPRIKTAAHAIEEGIGDVATGLFSFYDLAKAAIDAADAVVPSPWRNMKDAPRRRSIFLFGLPADEEGIAHSTGPEVRQVGFFSEHTGGWWTADLTRFIPRLWADLPAVPDEAITLTKQIKEPTHEQR